MLSCHCQIAGQCCSCDCSYCPSSSSTDWLGSVLVTHWKPDPASSVEECRRRALRCLTTALNTAYERTEGGAAVAALGVHLEACDPCCRQMLSQRCYSYCSEMIDCACCCGQRPSDAWRLHHDVSSSLPFAYRSPMAGAVAEK